MPSGFLRVATIGSTTVRVHWVAPLVWFIGGATANRAELALSGMLAAVVVYAVHAVGHAFLAHFYRLQLNRVDVDGLGASVATSGRATRGVHARVAFGGVIAHLVFGVVLMAVAGSGSELGRQMLRVNVLLGVVNLLPFGRLDGATGWRHLTAVLKQPMGPPHPGSAQLVRRSREMVREVDRELGHSKVTRPTGEPSQEEAPAPMASDVETLRELERQAESLMSQVRADVHHRNAQLPSDDEG